VEIDDNSVNVSDLVLPELAGCVVGFVNAYGSGFSLAGSGSFVRIGDRFGILTAAHVLDAIGVDRIGLVVFSRSSRVQRYTIGAQTERRVTLPWSNARSGGRLSDLGFLSISPAERIDLEVLGCVFTDLNAPTKFTHQYDTSDGPLFVTVVVEEWAGKLDVGNRARVTTFKALVGACQAIRVLPHDVMAVTPNHEPGHLDAPSSYGGVSGGGLWSLKFYRDTRAETDVLIERKLLGVAFYESSSRPAGRQILCLGQRWINEALIPAISAALPVG
jgi:hypothetical protein